MKNTNINVGFLGLFSSLLLAGCANNPYYSPPPTAEARASLGRVAVQSAPSVTQASLKKPYTYGEAAAAGAMDAISGIGSSGSGGDFGGVVIVLLPIAAVVGGTAGGVHGTPKAEAQAQWQLLSNACASLDFQKTLRQNVVVAMGKYTRIPVVRDGQTVMSARRTADTLLEVNVLQAGLVGKRYENSPMMVFLTAQARLVRLSDGQELYKHIWTETGGNYTYRQWASQDARLFDRELSYLCWKVAVIMVRNIFLAQPRESFGRWFAGGANQGPWRNHDSTIKGGFLAR